MGRIQRVLGPARNNMNAELLELARDRVLEMIEDINVKIYDEMIAIEKLQAQIRNCETFE